jgi:endoglucanase
MRDFSYRRKTAKIASCATGILAIIFFASSSSGSDSSILTPAPVLQLQKQLSPGINLGNTLEAMSGETPPARRSWETAWGNPPVNKAVFEAYKAAGFKSVRIPVSWNQYADADGNITPSWMARVKQVVDSARDSGLYVMINVHWDGGWLNHTTYAQQAANNAKLTKFWIQIATTFKDYDDHLLFAGTNEVGQDNTSGAPTPEYCAVQNGYNQTFVNTVRAIGGNNATRNLVVQAYFTSIDAAISCNAMMPVDTVKNRLAMEVHYYGPYNFALNGDSKIWQWGKNATDPNAREE